MTGGLPPGRQRAPELPKRFYKTVTTGPAAGGFTVLLDGRAARGPNGAPEVVPTKGLADRLAAEWQAQTDRIDPASMPVTALVNAALGAGEAGQAALKTEIVKFAASDLLVYRAGEPEDLVARQSEMWDRALAAFSQRFDVVFEPTTGVVHRPQPAATLTRVEALAAAFGPCSLTALVSATGLLGSAVLGIGVAHALFSRDLAWQAGHLDEDFNIERWGEDAEAATRRAFRRTEYDAALDVIELAGIGA